MMQTVYVALAASLMLIWLVLAVIGPRKAETPNVLAALRYGGGLRLLALLLALAPPLMMLYAVWAFLFSTPTKLNVAGISFLAASVMAGLLLIEVTRVQILLTDDGLTRFSPWSATATLRWDAVEHVGYSSVNRWFTVEGGGQTIRVSRHVVGIRVFADLVHRKLAMERRVAVIKVFDSL